MFDDKPAERIIFYLAPLVEDEKDIARREREKAKGENHA